MTASQESAVTALRGESLVSDQRLALVCGGCGKRGTYSVGRIFLDPGRMGEKAEPARPLEESIAFGGLFRCKRCGGSGPWKFPQTTRMQLFGMMLRRLIYKDKSEIQIGILQAFDGTRPKCGAQAEDHLKAKIAECPDDAFLWNRLGNLYDNAGHKKLAWPAYERAVELDPGEIESNYTLGCYCMNEGDLQGAAECFQRVAKHARTAPRRNPELLEDIVRDTLERMLELHLEDGTIPFPPKFDTPPLHAPPQPDEPSVVYMTQLDLGTKDGWDTLTALCLTGKMPEHMIERARKRTDSVKTKQRRLPVGASQPEVAEAKPQSRRIGRNDPCPCGSGRKYKRCCG